MGKFASFIRNTTLIAIVGVLAHLAYRLYIVTIEISILITKLNETNLLIRNLYEVMRNIKFSLF